MPTQGTNHKRITLACALTLALAGTLNPVCAFANDVPESERVRQQAEAMTQQIEDATQSYMAAEAEVDDLREQIEQNEQRTAEIEEELPEQRERTAASVKAMYLIQQSSQGILDLILTSKNFNEFIATLSYIDNIHQRNSKEIEALAALNQELLDTKAELELEYDAAAQAQDEALAALEEARAIKQQLQQRAQEIAAREEKERQEAIAAAKEAQRKAEEEKAAKEKAEAEQRAQEQAEAEEAQKQEEEAAAATFTTSSGNTATVEVPDEASVSTEPMASNTTSQESSGWAARIDAYLAGSPLAGYGSTFAEAAAQYGVDPRFSPAISCIESGKGRYCFRTYNAWGWGGINWPDWKTAIYAHVKGLATGYDGTLTLEGARRYCPPTYQEWYSSVLAEMNSI